MGGLVNTCRNCPNKENCTHFGIYDPDATECAGQTFSIDGLLDDPLPVRDEEFALYEELPADAGDDYYLEAEEELVQW